MNKERRIMKKGEESKSLQRKQGNDKIKGRKGKQESCTTAGNLAQCYYICMFLWLSNVTIFACFFDLAQCYYLKISQL